MFCLTRVPYCECLNESCRPVFSMISSDKNGQVVPLSKKQKRLHKIYMEAYQRCAHRVFETHTEPIATSLGSEERGIR